MCHSVSRLQEKNTFKKNQKVLRWIRLIKKEEGENKDSFLCQRFLQFKIIVSPMALKEKINVIVVYMLLVSRRSHFFSLMLFWATGINSNGKRLFLPLHKIQWHPHIIIFLFFSFKVPIQISLRDKIIFKVYVSSPCSADGPACFILWNPADPSS